MKLNTNLWGDRLSEIAPPRSYTKTVELERFLTLGCIAYLVSWECTIKRWEDDYFFPTVECVSEVQAFDCGGHKVMSQTIKYSLYAMATAWCREHIDEIIDKIEKGN